MINKLFKQKHIDDAQEYMQLISPTAAMPDAKFKQQLKTRIMAEQRSSFNLLDLRSMVTLHKFTDAFYAVAMAAVVLGGVTLVNTNASSKPDTYQSTNQYKSPESTETNNIPAQPRAPYALANPLSISKADPNNSMVKNITWVSPLQNCAGTRITMGTASNHTGVDMTSTQPNCVIKAAADGVVVSRGFFPFAGVYVTIDHGNDVRTNYFHGAPGSFKVNEGDKVKAGQEIMTLGCSGSCTGTHVHFELIIGNSYLNPVDYIKLP